MHGNFMRRSGCPCTRCFEVGAPAGVSTHFAHGQECFASVSKAKLSQKAVQTVPHSRCLGHHKGGIVALNTTPSIP